MSRHVGRTTRRIGLLVCAALVVTSSAAHGQLLGPLSEDEEVALGRLAAAEIEKDLTLLTDDAVTSYVSELGLALAARSGRSHLTYQFKVVDAAEINAFALPGGFIYVHRGLIEATETEAELAGVLGHEIGHVVARHGAKQAQRAAIATLGLRVLGSVLGRGTGGRIGAMAAEMVTAGTFMRFSRDAEREADRLGAENVAAGGHDPHGMVTFFEKLDRLREGQSNAAERFFSSHPSPAERVSNIQDLVVSLTDGRELLGDSAGFRDVKTRLDELPPPPAPAEPSPEDTSEAHSGPDVAPAAAAPIDVTYAGAEQDHEIAVRLAPVFWQALGSNPRYDYITRFDFDGDWQGDNNWDNAADDRRALPAVVYFNVSETTTHYFVHYAAFHPRDYKGGSVRGVVLSEILREGAGRYGDYDPTGLAEEVVLAHENDMEGALVVAAKATSGLRGVRLVYVETLAHNQFLQYEVSRSLFNLFGRRDDGIRVENEHPVLYIEPKGHGIDAFRGGSQLEDVEGFVVYRYGGEAEEASATQGREEVGYDLVSMSETLWPLAQSGENAIYGGTFDYRTHTVTVAHADGDTAAREVVVGPIGSVFRGTVGGRNMARPPWGWFDRDERDRRQGEWFLTPAETVKRHFELDDTFSTAYVHHPVLGIYRD